MNWLLWSLLGLAALFAVFALGPAIVGYYCIFKRKKAILLEDKDLSQTYFAPYADEVRDALAFLRETPFEEVAITAKDGVELKADHYVCGSDKTVIFFHGYCSAPQNNFCVQARDLYRRGYNMLLVHQRGHGKSGGKHTTMGLSERYDLLSWLDWVAEQPTARRIVLYGTSMGGTTIAYASPMLADRTSVKAMVLDCGFLVPYEQLCRECKVRHVPAESMMIVVRWLAKLRLKVDPEESTTESLKQARTPALFLHGTGDETVPVKRGIDAYESCAAEKELIVVEGAAHTISYLVGGVEVRTKVWDFLERCIG